MPLKSWCGWRGTIVPFFTELPQSCSLLLCQGALTTPISHLPSLSEAGLTTNLWVTPPSGWICAPVKKRINNFWGKREYPDGVWLCDCSSLAGGQDATGLLAVNEQYRSHNKASMGRKPSLEAVPVILERDQFPPVAPDSGWDLPLAAADNRRKLEGRTPGKGPPAATGSGYKEMEGISRGRVCQSSSPLPCSLRPPQHRQQAGEEGHQRLAFQGRQHQQKLLVMAVNKTKPSILGADAGAEVTPLPPGQCSPFRWHFCCPWTCLALLGAKRLSGERAVQVDPHLAGVLLNPGRVCLFCWLWDLLFAKTNTLKNSLVFPVRC